MTYQLSDNTYFWSVVFLMLAGTLSIRFSMIALSSKIVISERTKEIFSFIPAAILPAFIAPSAFFHQGQVLSLGGKERMVVLIFVTFLFLWTRSTLATICVGLSALYLLTQFPF